MSGFLYLFISAFVVHSSVHSNKHAFSLDKTWPHSSVRSLPVFGSAVAVDKNNNLILLHRGSSSNKLKNESNSVFIKETVVMIVSSKTGKIVGNWGANIFVKPHGIEVTGSDIFITDVEMHQVLKFVHDPGTGLWKTHAVLVLGEKFVSGSGPSHFCRPTDVAVHSGNEDFYVADGYCNSRIVKFNKNGLYKGEFTAGLSNALKSSEIHHFNVTHSITIASPLIKSPKNTSFAPLILVADRNNGRVQAFFENGTFVYEIPYQKFGMTKEMLLSVRFSSPWSITATDQPYGTLFAVIGHLPVGESKIFEIFVGVTGYSFRDSFPFTHKSGIKTSMRVETPHDIAVSEDGNTIYVIEAFPKLIIKKFEKSHKIRSNAACTKLAHLFYIGIMVRIITLLDIRIFIITNVFS